MGEAMTGKAAAGMLDDGVLSLIGVVGIPRVGLDAAQQREAAPAPAPQSLRSIASAPGPALPRWRPGLHRTVLDARLGIPDLDGYLPDHLPLQPVPPQIDKSLQVRPFINALSRSKTDRMATTVFAPENRYTFSDTSFPWCTMGRVDTAGGWLGQQRSLRERRLDQLDQFLINQKETP